MIHYFGLGFIQLKINDTYRLHFYTEKLKAKVSPEEVHNHRYDFKSTILRGQLTQETYQVIEGNTHLMEPESCDPKVKLYMPAQECALKFTGIHCYTEGSIYYLPHGVFHKVLDTDDCITLIERKTYSKELAEVVRPKDSKKVCPFAGNLAEDDLWYIVDKIIKKESV